MPTFRIIGADRETGHAVKLFIDADSRAAAERYALSKGVLTSQVEEARPRAEDSEDAAAPAAPAAESHSGRGAEVSDPAGRRLGRRGERVQIVRVYTSADLIVSIALGIVLGFVLVALLGCLIGMLPFGIGGAWRTLN